jgi:hypothetical protein
MGMRGLSGFVVRHGLAVVLFSGTWIRQEQSR